MLANVRYWLTTAHKLVELPFNLSKHILGSAHSSSIQANNAKSLNVMGCVSCKTRTLKCRKTWIQLVSGCQHVSLYRGREETGVVCFLDPVLTLLQGSICHSFISSPHKFWTSSQIQTNNVLRKRSISLLVVAIYMNHLLKLQRLLYM